MLMIFFYVLLILLSSDFVGFSMIEHCRRSRSFNIDIQFYFSSSGFLEKADKSCKSALDRFVCKDEDGS